MPIVRVKQNGKWEDVAGASSHVHNTSDITDFPASLPADGGHADKATKDGNGNVITNTYATKSYVSAMEQEFHNAFVTDSLEAENADVYELETCGLTLKPRDTENTEESIYFSYYEDNNTLEIGDVGGDQPVVIRGVADPVYDNEAANRGYVNRAIQDGIEGCTRVRLHVWEDTD